MLIVTTPSGVVIPICNNSYGKPCVDRFTPFIGKRIAVGELNADGKPDVAVVSDAKVERIYPPSSCLEAARAGFNGERGIGSSG